MSYNPVRLGPGMTVLPDGSIDVSNFIATGSVTARSYADRASDTLNVLDNGFVADGTTDNSPALTALLTRASLKASLIGGGRIQISIPSGLYGLKTSVSIPSNVELLGHGSPVLRAIGTTGTMLNISNVSNVAIRNIKLDAQNSVNTTIVPHVNINNSHDVLIEDVELIQSRGGFYCVNSYAISINRPKVIGSLLHGVYFSGCYDSQVSNGVFQSGGGFGVILTGGCYRNLIIGNRTTANRLELIGVTQDSYENRIINNHAEGTGDNGISVTGYKNIICGNIAKGCQGNGIEIYGERNTCTGNTCLNNAKGNVENSGWRSGIAIHGAFGGVGQWNTVTGNICDDDQTDMTQLYGVWINATTYQPWAAGQTLTVGSYRYVGLNLYKTTSAGVTGSTTPSGTGASSDGSVSWVHVREFSAGTVACDYNEISSNMVRRFGVARYFDGSGGTHNEFTGGLVPVSLPSPIIASQISNTGGVASVNPPTGNYGFSNGSLPTLAIDAPASGGQQATAVVASMVLFGFGNVSLGGSGYKVGDLPTFRDGTPNGNALAIKVTAVDANGAITAFTSGGGSFVYSALPPAGTTKLTGGSGTGAELTGTTWHVNAITVTAAGSNYVSVPSVKYTPSIGSATSSVVLSSSLTLNSGFGGIVMDGEGTKLGVAGSPVIAQGAFVDGSGIRKILTGTASTIPTGTSLVRFTQTATIPTQTIVLPTVDKDGYAIQFVQYSGSITALTFSPAVNGWTNSNPMAANTGIRVRWDAAFSAWYREQ